MANLGDRIEILIAHHRHDDHYASSAIRDEIMVMIKDEIGD